MNQISLNVSCTCELDQISNSSAINDYIPQWFRYQGKIYIAPDLIGPPWHDLEGEEQEEQIYLRAFYQGKQIGQNSLEEGMEGGMQCQV